MIFYIIILLFSVVIHEYMHGWMADQLGDPTAKDAGRLTLNPAAHLDIWGSIIMPALIFITAGFPFGYAKPVPFNPHNLRDQKYGIAKVAAAGPLANLITAIFFGLILRFIPGLNIVMVSFLIAIVRTNLVLMIFNLLPIPPLDGSKVLLPFLPYNLQIKLLSLEHYGFTLVLLFALFGFSLIAPIISFMFRLIVGT